MNNKFSKGPLVYDILIGTSHSSCAVSMGSHNKPGNQGSALLPRRDGGGERLFCEMGCEVYSD